MIHLSETGPHAGRRLCLASREDGSESVHATYAPLHKPEFRETVCPTCLQIWADEAYEAGDPMPDYIAAIRQQRTASQGACAQSGINPNLLPYRVMLHEEPGDKFQLVFDCQAEDDDHAAEQAENAYPGCEIVSTLPFEEAEEAEFVAYSKNESVHGEGYWSNDLGWVESSAATKFTKTETKTLQLPISSGQDAKWMLAEQLVNLRLVLDVTYRLNGEKATELASNLWKLVDHAIANGLLTGQTAAEVEEYSTEVDTPNVEPLQQTNCGNIKVSLDGGDSYQQTPAGVRIIYENVPVPGEDENGELHINVTSEGLIMDAWATRAAPLDHNIGTSSEMVEDIIHRLVETIG